jgi:hypothetical protein
MEGKRESAGVYLRVAIAGLGAPPAIVGSPETATR